ncbi:alpha-L-rhamnosidase C-terminal domain-containing protein [Dactylosporangium maewongense]|uniref:alpha-L-rhamnosidase C-terminal domain-containing protein n=1 Tax=Dactylosporangium maewongense TaxID=634393 RepID=UPI0031E39B0B
MTIATAACKPDLPSEVPTWPENVNWQALVPGPSSDDVLPVGITRTLGSVTNADALLGKGGETVLTVEPGGPPAVVVLDYGHEVGGTPYVNVSRSTVTAPATSNTLRVSTSEALKFLNASTTTTLSGAANAGDTNVKVASVAPFYAGTQITVGIGDGAETRTITAVGTAGAAGSGITFSPALTAAHPTGTTATGIGTYVNDNGAQINLTITNPQTYTGGLRGGLRFEAIELRTPGTVTLTRAGLNFKAYRAAPDKYEGWFYSSDDQLNRMWYAGAYTAQMDMVPVGVASCFNVPVIFDGAKRDRAIWSGDLMITDPVAMLSIGSNSHPYVRGSIDSILNLQAASGRLTSAVGFRGCGAFDYAVTYSAYSAIIAVQYLRYSGDTEYVKGLLPKLEAATAYHATRVNGNGLVVTNDNDYWQTRQNGEVTEYSLAYYELLQDMIWLESHIGSADKVAEYTQKAANLKAAINGRLFNQDAGLYQHTDTRPSVFPLDANMNAIRLGVAPADKVQHILTYFKDRWQPHGSEISQPAPSMKDPYGHTIEPLNNTWEMMARIQSNDAAGAIELLRRLWGLQVDPNSPFYTGTFWEFVMSDGFPDRGFDSLAHAWGAGPTQILTESVLGATPVDPGYAKWALKPQPTDLAWAQGQVPTPRGALSVKWAQDAGKGTFHMEVVAPQGTSGEVWVPLSSATQSISGPLTPGATFLRRSGSYDVYSVGAGTFEFGSAPVSFELLKALVAHFSVNADVAQGLADKLDRASAAKSATTRGNALDAFTNQVNAQTGKALTPDEAKVLITVANALR